MPSTERRNGGLSRRLHRETMALRIVAVTMRGALREHDRHEATPGRSAWAADLVAWSEGVIEYHRRRVQHLRRELLDDPDAPPDKTPQRLRELLGELEGALADAEDTAVEARARSGPVDPHSARSRPGDEP